MSAFEIGISFAAIFLALGLGLVVHERQKQWPRNTQRHFGWSRHVIARDTSHFFRKLCGTVRIIGTLALARTFGRYEVSVYADGVHYAKYHWRGKTWAFPTEPIEAGQ